jgi:hypothetical protein
MSVSTRLASSGYFRVVDKPDVVLPSAKACPTNYWYLFAVVVAAPLVWLAPPEP